MTRRQSPFGLWTCALALIGFLFLLLNARAAGESEVTRAEVAQLLRFVRTSSCEFYRNGSWHSAQDAHDHLVAKVSYLREKATIPNAEYVVREVATASSISGHPYQIRCQNQIIQSCSTWLLDELKRIRLSVRPQP